MASHNLKMSQQVNGFTSQMVEILVLNLELVKEQWIVKYEFKSTHWLAAKWSLMDSTN